MENSVDLTIAPTRHTPSFDVGGPGPYRLARHDARNIVLQRRNQKLQWVSVAFCGNNPRSIARVVSELATRHWTPADGDQDLAGQVADLRRAIEALTAAIIAGVANEI